LRLLLLVAALVVVVVVVLADRGRRGPGDDDVAGEDVCAARQSGRSWVARGRVADAHDGGCDGGEHCRGCFGGGLLVLMLGLWLMDVVRMAMAAA
jgi:hypothetical protein